MLLAVACCWLLSVAGVDRCCLFVVVVCFLSYVVRCVMLVVCCDLLVLQCAVRCLTLVAMCGLLMLFVVICGLVRVVVCSFGAALCVVRCCCLLFEVRCC